MNCPICHRPVPEGQSVCLNCVTELPGRTPTTTDPGGAPSQGDMPEFPPGHIFAGRFTIIERARSGGMGVVYKAIDNSLHEVVALKLIRPERAASPAWIERFKREVKLTRQVTHPNVCRVHDLGESDGLLYLSMQWITGESLRQLLHKTHVIDEERTAAIAERIASALEAAHARGIIHRDLKPENVMIDERGEVFVLDFGIAIEQDRNETGAQVIGTPAYMSPEQRRNEPLDERTDLFSLGLILREMVTGRPPVEGQRFDTGARRAVSRPLLALLDALLAEDRQARCPSAGQALRLIARLRLAVPDDPRRRLRLRLAAVALAPLALAGAVAVYLMRGPADSPSAALPYHERGLALREMAETPRALDDAIRLFREGVAKDPNAAIVWAAMGEAYAKRYEWNRDTGSRDEAMQAVEQAFRLDEDLPEARNARATGFIAERDYRAAKTELELAVKARPEMDAAWANLGRVLGELGDYPNGLAALRRAISLAPASFRHHLALGRFFDRAGEFDGAVTQYRRALELKPDSTMAWNLLGTAYLRTNRYPDAAAAFRRSIEVEERGANRSNLGTALYYMKDYAGAVESYRHAARLEPARSIHWGNAGDALRMMGQHDEAREAYLTAATLSRQEVNQAPSHADGRSCLALWCARSSAPGCDPLAEGERALQAQPDNATIVFRNAMIRALLGRREEALDLLERAVHLGISRSEIENEPDFSSLVSSPRYQRILELAS